jgi:hypothetical protein
MSGGERAEWRRVISFPKEHRRAAEPWTFAAIADAHCTPTSASIQHGRGLKHLGDGPVRLRRCFDAIEAQEDRPEFCLLLGDIGLDDAMDVLASAPCPIYPVAGNYEWGDARQRLRDAYPAQLGAADYYAFVHNGVRVVGLCTAGIGNDHVGQLASEGIRPPGQSNWLAEELSGSWEPRILFAHCPPRPPGFDSQAYLEQSAHDYLPFLGENDSRFVLELLQNRGPMLYLAGHLHRATHGFDIADSHVIVVRSCNWNHDAEAIGFLLVRVDADGLSVREALTGEPDG